MEWIVSEPGSRGADLRLRGATAEAVFRDRSGGLIVLGRKAQGVRRTA